MPFFSGTEMAVISLNDAKMHKLAEEGDRKALRVIKFLDNPGNFLATIQVGVTLAGFRSDIDHHTDLFLRDRLVGLVRLAPDEH